MMAKSLRSPDRLPKLPRTGPPANIVFKPHAPLHALPHALWWQPGVYGSGPAVVLWIVARLPADTLAAVFGTPLAPALFNHAGDTVFVTGWIASTLWLWFTRKKPAPPAQNDAVTAVPDPSQPHTQTRQM